MPGKLHGYSLWNPCPDHVPYSRPSEIVEDLCWDFQDFFIASLISDHYWIPLLIFEHFPKSGFDTSRLPRLTELSNGLSVKLKDIPNRLHSKNNIIDQAKRGTII